MLDKLLSEKIFNVIKTKFEFNKIYEVRLRVNMPVVVCYDGYNVILKDNANGAVYAEKQDIERVVAVASNYSLYSVENQIKQAFICTKYGYRIRLAGEISGGDGTIKAIKNIYSVNIRVPHDVKNCSYKIMQYIRHKNLIYNTLIISPPGAGKTTLIRDICVALSKEENPMNILLIDERYEIAGVSDGVPTIDVGKYVDILSGASKSYGFSFGIRSLKPNIIVTDEIGGQEDVESIKYAIKSGVKVIATIHGENIDDIKNKKYYGDILAQNFFERIIVLSDENHPGECVCIYNEQLKPLFY